MSSICSTVRSGNLFHKLWYKNVNGKRSKGNSNSSSRGSTKVQRSCSRTLMRTWVAYLQCSAGAQKSTGRSNHQSDPRKSCALHQQCLLKSTSAYHNRQRTSRMILKCASYNRQCFGTGAREDRMRRTPNHNSADPIRIMSIRRVVVIAILRGCCCRIRVPSPGVVPRPIVVIILCDQARWSSSKRLKKQSCLALCGCLWPGERHPAV